MTKDTHENDQPLSEIPDDDQQFSDQYDAVVADILGNNEVHMLYLAKLMVTAPFSGNPGFPFREEHMNRLDSILGKHDRFGWWLQALGVATGPDMQIFEEIAGLATDRRGAAIEQIKRFRAHRDSDGYCLDKLQKSLTHPSPTVRYCTVTALLLLTTPRHEHRFHHSDIATSVWNAIPRNLDLFRESFDWLIAALYTPNDVIAVETGDIGGHDLPEHLPREVLRGRRELIPYIEQCSGSGERADALAKYMRDCIG